MMALMKALEAHHHAGADAEVVLVVVGAVIECGDEVVRFDETNRKMAIGFQVEASADVGGEGCAGVNRAWIAAFNECAGRVRQARKNLSERLHGPMVNRRQIADAGGERAHGERVCTAADAAGVRDGKVAD